MCVCFGRDGAPEKEEPVGAECATDGARWPHSVQWLDVGQSVLFADVCGQYRSLLWALCSKALRLQLHVPPAGGTAGSINLQHTLTGFHILHSMRHASHTGNKIMSGVLTQRDQQALLER